MSTLKSYIDEIFELQHTLFYIEDGLLSLLLWRGQREYIIPQLEVKVHVPIHSIFAFLFSVFLIEYPTFIPSFCFMSIAWLLIAIGEWRRGAENVWWHCHSYAQIFKMLTFGDDYVQPHRIEPFANYEKAKKEMEEMVKRIEDTEKQATRDAEEANKAMIERQKELAEIGQLDTDLGTKVNGAGLTPNPVKAALYPIQLMLGILVRGIRIIKNILMWQEAYISFWLTTGSLVLGILSIFIPWLWCLKWGSRIFVWTIFGPWMKLVDIYYVSLIEPETEEQRQRRKQTEKLSRKLTHNESVIQSRIIREDIVKLKVMRQHVFGRYSLRVPIIKQDRYADIPLAESFATPYKENEYTLGELAMQEAGYKKKRIPGQTLVGDMIPHVQEEAFTQAPIGKAALHTEKLSKNLSRSEGIMITDKSKITLLVALAVGITYYGTSLLVVLLTQTDIWIRLYVFSGTVNNEL